MVSTLKKLSTRHRNFLIRKARHRPARRATSYLPSTYYTPSGPQAVFGKTAKNLPAKLCLHENLKVTIEFLFNLRSQTLNFNKHLPATPKPIKRGAPRKFRNYYDFTTLREISSGAALILAAEFDRMYKVRGAVPSAIDLEKWDSNVYATFFHLGFFDLMGFHKKQLLEFEAQLPKELAPLQIMKMVSGKLADTSDVIGPLEDLIDEAITSDDSTIKVALCGALVDALENVRQHAYPKWKQSKLAIPPFWWLSGSVSKRDRILTISLYDQGVTIPKSMLNSEVWRPTFESYKKLIGKDMYADRKIDQYALNAAMQKHETSTELAHRGLGLPKIKKIVSECPGGKLLILSHRGLYRHSDGTDTCTTMDLPLLGTYVEMQVQF